MITELTTDNKRRHATHHQSSNASSWRTAYIAVLKCLKVYNLDEISSDKHHYVLLNDVQIWTPLSFISKWVTVDWRLMAIFSLFHIQQSRGHLVRHICPTSHPDWNRHNVITSKQQVHACKCSMLWILTDVSIQPQTCIAVPFYAKPSSCRGFKLTISIISRIYSGSVPKFNHIFSGP